MKKIDLMNSVWKLTVFGKFWEFINSKQLLTVINGRRNISSHAILVDIDVLKLNFKIEFGFLG